LRPDSPAIHIERLPGHESRVVAGEKRQRADQIVGHLDPPDRLQAGDGDKPMMSFLLRTQNGAWIMVNILLSRSYVFARNRLARQMRA
jgi:hypothetical protein